MPSFVVTLFYSTSNSAPSHLLKCGCSLLRLPRKQYSFVCRFSGRRLCRSHKQTSGNHSTVRRERLCFKRRKRMRWGSHHSREFCSQSAFRLQSRGRSNVNCVSLLFCVNRLLSL